MDSKFVIFAVISTLLMLTIYSSSTTLEVSGATKGPIYCTGSEGKLKCCQSEFDDKGNVVATWCTTCDIGNPPSNCTPREKTLGVVNPGKMLSNVLEGGVLEEPTTAPKFGQNVIPKEGRVLEQPTENNTAPSEGPSRLLEPNTGLSGLGDLKVAPDTPDSTYECKKDPGDARGICTSTGARDSVLLYQDKSTVCKGEILCNDKHCQCVSKQ